jgi:hypothetical protein
MLHERKVTETMLAGFLTGPSRRFAELAGIEHEA